MAVVSGADENGKRNNGIGIVQGTGPLLALSIMHAVVTASLIVPVRVGEDA